MKSWIKYTGVVIAAGFVLLQFTSPDLSNPPVQPGHDLMAENPPPPDVSTPLHNACYDCHSDQTRWPWYSHVAPVSWWVVGHVKDARAALNFSDWPHAHPSWARKRWRHIADAVENKEMPLPHYDWMHPEARLTDEQRARLVQWAKQAGHSDND